MPSRIWDAYKTFNIVIPSYGGDLFCAGRAQSRGGAQCRIRLPGETCSTIRSILSRMETGPPNEAEQRRLLQQLARLSLCEDYHRQPDQLDKLLNKWEDAMEDVIENHEKDRKLERLEESSKNSEALQAKIERLEMSLHETSLDFEEERRKFAKYKRDAEAKESRRSRVLDDLESDLDEERRKSAKRKDDL